MHCLTRLPLAGVFSAYLFAFNCASLARLAANFCIGVIIAAPSAGVAAAAGVAADGVCAAVGVETAEAIERLLLGRIGVPLVPEVVRISRPMDAARDRGVALALPDATAAALSLIVGREGGVVKHLVFKMKHMPRKRAAAAEHVG